MTHWEALPAPLTVAGKEMGIEKERERGGEEGKGGNRKLRLNKRYQKSNSC